MATIVYICDDPNLGPGEAFPIAEKKWNKCKSNPHGEILAREVHAGDGDVIVIQDS